MGIFHSIVAEPFAGAAPPFGSKDEDKDDSEETEEEAEASLTITAEPFPGAAPPFGSKDEDSDEDSDDDDGDEEAEASLLYWSGSKTEAEANWLAWEVLWTHAAALDAIPDSITDDPTDCPHAVDHSKDGEARDTSTGGFAAAARLVAGNGITSPVSKLPPAPQGAADRAKERSKMGRGIEGGGDDGVDPMSTMDKFNWDNLPLPGLGQI